MVFVKASDPTKALLSCLVNESRSSFLLLPADCTHIMLPRIPNQTELNLDSVVPSKWAAITQLELDGRSEELLQTIDICDPRPYPCLPDQSRTQMTISSCLSELECLVLSRDA